MILRKLLPSSSALFMFEAAARHSSFTRAAADFNVTQSAVSRMIKRFEVHLGTALFNRGPTGLELTEAGTKLFRATSHGFRTIEAALEELREDQGNSQIVSISLSAAFAVHWLVPLVDKFKVDLPNVDLRLQLVQGEPVGPFEDVDLAIRYNHPADFEQYSWKLMDEVIVPICSSDYRTRHGTLDAPTGGAGHVLAELSGTTRVPWRRFLESAGLAPAAPLRTIVLSDYSLVIQAALKGRAVALGWLHVVGRELLEDGLVRAGRQQLRTGLSYDIVASASRPLRTSAVLVKDWLTAEMAMMDRKLSEAEFLSP